MFIEGVIIVLVAGILFVAWIADELSKPRK